jgi:streptogramin lyase
MVAGNGSVWIRRDFLAMARVDPDTARVVQEVEFDPGLCAGLGFTDGRLWTCSQGELIVLDPAKGGVAFRTGVQMHPDQGLIGFGNGIAWVLDAPYGERLIGLDLDTGEVVHRTPLNVKCEQLAVGFDSVWIACPIDQVLLRVDLESGSVVDEVEGLSGSSVVAIGPDSVWTNSSGDEGGLLRIDPATLEPTYFRDVKDPTSSGMIAVDGNDVWVRGEETFLTRFDSADGRAVEAFVSSDLKGGSVLPAFGSVWATADDANRLVRLDL